MSTCQNRIIRHNQNTFFLDVTNLVFKLVNLYADKELQIRFLNQHGQNNFITNRAKTLPTRFRMFAGKIPHFMNKDEFSYEKTAVFSPLFYGAFAHKRQDNMTHNLSYCHEFGEQF